MFSSQDCRLPTRLAVPATLVALFVVLLLSSGLSPPVVHVGATGGAGVAVVVALPSQFQSAPESLSPTLSPAPTPSPSTPPAIPRVVSGDWTKPAPGATAWVCEAPIACVSGPGGRDAASDCAARHPGALSLVADPLSSDNGPLPLGMTRAQASAWLAMRGNSTAANRNRAYAAALAARSCAVWDTDAGVRLTLGGGVGLLDAAATTLKPIFAPAPVYLGVRPRSVASPSRAYANAALAAKHDSTGGGGSGSSIWGALVNPLVALAPSSYFWPRGYPPHRAEAERNGTAPGTAELVRLAAADSATPAESTVSVVREGDIAVIEAALSGAPNSGANELAASISYHGKLPLVLLAPGAVAPFGALTSLVRGQGLWALFLPTSERLSDVAVVWRSLIAQAIFELCGLRVGFAPSWATRDMSSVSRSDSFIDNDNTFDSAKGVESLMNALIVWVADRWAVCPSSSSSLSGHVSTSSVRALPSFSKPAASDTSCGDAAALLEDVYFFLGSRGFVETQDILALQAWLTALRGSGYTFPGSIFNSSRAQSPWREGASRSSPLLSSSRPSKFDALDVHAAVHINWARDTASAAVPMWHVVHAAQFRSVSYHLDVSGQGADAHAPATYFPALASQVAPSPAWPPAPAGAPSGYYAYESFLSEWGCRSGLGRSNTSTVDVAASAMLWTHDDLVTDPRAIRTWLSGATSSNLTSGGGEQCVVVMDSPGDSEVLPPVTSWSAGTWWLPRLVGEGAALISGAIPCAARGGSPLADGQLWKGYSDAFAVRRGCAGADAFVGTLSAVRRAGAFLEIAVHSAANCAEPNAALGKWREYSLWTDRRGDALAYRDASRGEAPPPVLHPLKLSDPVAVAVTVELRDAAWAEA